MFAIALVAIFSRSLADAQERSSDDERPRVERITFRGVEALDTDDLRRRIVTQATRCRSFLLEPFCLVAQWRFLLDEHHLDRRELAADELRLRLYYFQRGYRGAAIESVTRQRSAGVEVVFEVEEGPATILERVDVRQTAEVLSGRRIERARLPAREQTLDLIRLEGGLREIAGWLDDRGYLDHELHDSIVVSPDGLRASLAVEIDPGRRATVGALDIRGNEEVSDRTIANGLRMRPGRVLRAPDLVASQRSLFESNLFHEARVRVPEQPDSAKRVEVVVREAPTRRVRLGGGFNTTEFVQGEAGFTHFNLFGGSRRLDLRVTAGNLFADQLNGRGIFRDVVPEEVPGVDRRRFLQPTWQASVDLRQPSFLAAANVLGLGIFAHRRTIPGIAVDEGYGGELSLTRRFDQTLPVSVTYRLEMTGVSAGDLYFCVHYGICDQPTIEILRTPHRLSPAGLNFSANRADDPVGPTSGWRARLDLEYASGLTLSDFGYQRASAAAARYLPLDIDRRRVLAGRVRAGWVRASSAPNEGNDLEIPGVPDPLDPDEFEILHPRKRFYSGGARSVRGYRENQLGPRILTIPSSVLLDHDPDCGRAALEIGSCDASLVPTEDFLLRPVGGRAVLEANVEFRFPLTNSFHGAAFIDGAAVADGLAGVFGEGTRAITPGIGARWHSPVGPVRIDLGYHPRQVEELTVVTEFIDESGERRLVRLREPRRYDPTEGLDGFLDQLLGRLTLHLSFGEAF